LSKKKVINSVTKKITVYAQTLPQRHKSRAIRDFQNTPRQRKNTLNLSHGINKGTIPIFQEVGYSTKELGSLEVDDHIMH
jgi:hypothetical protein